MPKKQTNNERLKDIIDSIEKGIQELFQSDKYAQYLRTMSRFHRYSVNNTLLIYMQKPDATLIAGFSKWRNQFQRNVMKGEKGIKIIAPTPYKKKVEEQKLDPDTRQPMLDAQGNVIMDEKEVIIPMFKPVTVFDVSQTHGKPLPQLSSDLQGDVQNYEFFMEALRRSSPVPIDFKPIADNTDGFFSLDDQSITIREGMSEIQTVSAVVHEIAHSKLHNRSAEQPKDRNTEEVTAESVSFVVCAYYGFATGDNSFGYIASWSKGKELKELRESLETINKTSSELITDIDHHYAEIMKEREASITITPESANSIDAIARDVQEEEPTQAPDNGYMPDPSMSIEAMKAYGYTDENMLPLSKERALELMDRDVPVYMLYDDNTEAMAFEPEDIQLFSGMFAVERADWEQVRGTIPHMDGALVRQKKEYTFQNRQTDAFAIYQLKHDDSTVALRFMGSDWLQKKGLRPDKNNYDIVYTGSLTPSESRKETLEQLYRTFNVDRPEDFHGHSLSVSDIVALKEQGVISYHYVDSIGYLELPNFDKNYLKSAEMQMEDDYGMIDGIVNNGVKQTEKTDKKLPAKSTEDKSKRPSVLAKIRKLQAEEKQRNEKHRSAERNIC